MEGNTTVSQEQNDSNGTEIHLYLLAGDYDNDHECVCGGGEKRIHV
jgi:hypothetical protein